MILKMRYTSIIIQRFSKFHKEGGLFLQRLEPCAPIFDMESPVKTQVGNGLDKLFDFQVKNIDLSDK